MGDRPLLYVSFPWPEPTPEEASAALEHAARAAALGWAPVSAGWMPNLGASSREERLALVRPLVRACDAFLTVRTGRRTKSMEDDLEEFRKGWGHHAPIYSTRPDQPLGSRTLAAPPWHEWGEAAEFVAVEGWKCRTCSRWWGSDERMARTCCVKELPCDSCGAKVEKWRTLCAGCRDLRDQERHAGRKRVPWDGESPVWSDAEDEWFQSMDLAIDHAASRFEGREGRQPTDDELKEELESMRLLASEPEYGRELDPAEWLHDSLPDDDDGRSVAARLEAPAAAFNEAVRAIGPLSYHPGDEAIDVAAALSGQPTC